MDFSIIIPTRNSGKTLSKTLSSLSSLDYPRNLFEVIIVDFNSSDETLEIAKRFNVKIIKARSPGAAAARNAGIKEARGRLICFTDSDCVIPRDWLSKIYNKIKDNPEIAGVGGPIKPLGSHNIIQEFAGENFLEMMAYPPIEIFAESKRFWCSLITANCCYKKEIISAVGGFDENFFTSGEDIDLCWRIALSNKVLYDPNIIVYHIFPDNLKDLFKQYFKYGEGSSKLRKKHFNTGYIDWFIYKLLMKRTVGLLLPQISTRKKNALGCFQILSHIIGKIYGSIKEGVLNV